jgi:transcriptional regulator with XRE-family HTH domain
MCNCNAKSTVKKLTEKEMRIAALKQELARLESQPEAGTAPQERNAPVLKVGYLKLVACRVGVSSSYVSGYLHGRIQPNIDTARRIEDAIKFLGAELIGDTSCKSCT